MRSFYKEIDDWNKKIFITNIFFLNRFCKNKEIKENAIWIIVSQILSIYILNLDFLLSSRNVFTVFNVSCLNDFPNLSIFLIIEGGAVIIWQPKLLAWV